MSLDSLDLVAMVPDWLAVTRGRDVSVGLSREEALPRARVLRSLLRERKVNPQTVVLDEDLKDVFHELVALITELEPLVGGALAQEANTVYQFLAGIEWQEDAFEEKRDLQRCLAEAGWKAIGTNPHDVARRRSAGENRQKVYDFGVDPNSLTPIKDRSDELWESVLREPDTLLALCSELRARMNSSPAEVAKELPAIYCTVAGRALPGGLFDERDYLLGECALIGGTVFRHLGQLTEAERWLDRSESSFRHSVNPAPLLANIAYARLALRYDMREYDDVLELVPSLMRTFERLGMDRETVKSRFLEAMTLKESGKALQSMQKFESLREALEAQAAESGLLGLVLIEIGAYHGIEGNLQQAVDLYERALGVMGDSADAMTLAHLKGAMGEAYRAIGDLERAATAFRMAVADYSELGMALRTAYCRVILSETLLALDQSRDAEWEILQALPTIEEQKMVPEGFAAVALLRESVKRKKADPNALRELREHLQKQN